jgi:glycosyltransferase involved in cell wall biosynthesis
MKILVIAAACHPNLGSEPGVGYKWIEKLSEYYDIDVICGEKQGNKEAINEIQLKKGELKNVKFHFIERDKFNKFQLLITDTFKPIYYYYYNIWMKKAYQLAWQLMQCNSYALVHQLTMIGFREPGYLYKLNIKRVWGPIGGFSRIPTSYLIKLGFRDIVNYLIKIIGDILILKYSNRIKKSFTYSDSIISANYESQRSIRMLFTRESDIVLISPTFISSNHVKLSENDIVKLVVCGNLIGTKNVRMALDIFKRVERHNCELHIIGDGYQRKSLQDYANKIKINDRIHWYGRLSHNHTINVMKHNHIMLFPSLSEGSPGVVSEAISLGIPVICFAKDGQDVIVDDTCGVKIPITNPIRDVEVFADKLSYLLSNLHVINKLSEGALKVAKRFTLDNQIKTILNTYSRIGS